MTEPRRRKHRITVTLTVEEPITREAAADYIVDAVATMHGCRMFRYSDAAIEGTGGRTDFDEVLCGEVLEVRTQEGLTWTKS